MLAPKLSCAPEYQTNLESSIKISLDKSFGENYVAHVYFTKSTQLEFKTTLEVILRLHHRNSRADLNKK